MTSLLAAFLLIQQPALVVNNDARVVNAAMASFYKKSSWNDEWTEGAYVVVHPWKGKRYPFKTRLGEMIDYEKRFKRGKKAASLLARIQKSIVDRGFDPGRVLPLQELRLDSRIVVSEVRVQTSLGASWEKFKAQQEGRSYVEQRFKNREGKEGRARIGGGLLPPSYSPDGRYAILSMGTTWSGGFHGADLRFLLKKGASSWLVVHIQPILYV